MATVMTIAASNSAVTCYDPGASSKYGSSWSSATISSGKAFLACWTNYQSGFLNAYRQCRSRTSFTTGDAGATSVAVSIATASGWHALQSGQTAGTIYWTITDASNSNPSSGWTLSWDASNWRTPATGSRSINLLPHKTYYLWVWASATTSTFNGDMTLTLDGVYGQPGNIVANNADFGSQVSMLFAANPTTNANYTVQVTVPLTDGNASEVLQTKGAASSLTWTPDLSFYAPKITDRKSVTATITVQTYYGSTLAGTKTKTITLSIPSSLAVTTSNAFSCAPSPATAIAGITHGYVQNYSKARLTFTNSSQTVSLKQGATVSKWSVKVGNATAVDVDASTVTKDTGVLSEGVTIICTLTDSRGFTATETFTVSVMPYSLPSLAVIFYRCNEASPHAADDSGRAMAIKATATISGLNYDGEDQNVANIQVKWKPASGSGWAGTASLESDTLTIIGPLEQETEYNYEFADATYDILVTLTDTVGNQAQYADQMLTAKWALKFNSDGSGAAFGKAAEYSKRVQIPDDWEIIHDLDPMLGTHDQTTLLSEAQKIQAVANTGIFARSGRFGIPFMGQNSTPKKVVVCWGIKSVVSGTAISYGVTYDSGPMVISNIQGSSTSVWDCRPKTTPGVSDWTPIITRMVSGSPAEDTTNTHDVHWISIGYVTT